MPRIAIPRLSSSQAKAASLTVVAVALVLAGGMSFAAGSPRAGMPTKRVVALRHDAALEVTLLTTTKGRTLYSLSVEKHGKFVCTASCLSVWHPLVVPAGTKPTGPVKLGTIERPDNGATQVTYKGRPLYRFGGDSKAGQTNGDGIRDVGTWHPATAPNSTGSESPPQEKAPENPYGY
jgi:predicted lipoprotein with Yx(FWY)xxD motif